MRVHVVVTIPPTVLISDLVDQLKGASSRAVNVTFPAGPHFAWQTGYGVVTFGTRVMGWVVAYVESQKPHPAANTAHDRLERTTPVDEAT